MTEWLNPDQFLTMTCAECSEEFTKTVRDLRSEDNISCPICGTVYLLEGDLLKGVSESLDDFGRRPSR